MVLGGFPVNRLRMINSFGIANSIGSLKITTPFFLIWSAPSLSDYVRTQENSHTIFKNRTVSASSVFKDCLNTCITYLKLRSLKDSTLLWTIKGLIFSIDIYVWINCKWFRDDFFNITAYCHAKEVLSIYILWILNNPVDVIFDDGWISRHWMYHHNSFILITIGNDVFGMGFSWGSAAVWEFVIPGKNVQRLLIDMFKCVWNGLVDAVCLFLIVF